jgi:DNA modification methylase
MAKENTIICGDCLDIMRDMPDNSVDLVLTDPPYGIGEKWVGGKGNGWGQTDNEKLVRNRWDNKPPSQDTLLHVQRVGQNSIIWGGNYFMLPPSRCWLLWVKPERGFTLAEAEMAWTSFDKIVRVKEMPRHIKDRYHPTQKPYSLIEWCIENYSKPNALIFDPFCGSGTTCVAAKRLGRRYIGIDISPEYCDIARKRLEAEEKGITVKELEKGQGSLFYG